MNLKFSFGIIGSALVTVLTPTLLVAQTLPYGTARKPQTCASRVEPKTGKPSLVQAKMYFMCDQESQIGTPGQGLVTSFIRLINDLNLQIASKPRPVNSTDLQYNSSSEGTLSMDTDKPVYDIRGSFIRYTCFEVRHAFLSGKNCTVDQFPSSAGICFQNTFGDWHCRMKGSYKKIGDKLPPPEK